MKILGISAFYHDSAACLLINGQIIAGTQEERFTRKKHDPSFPKNATDYCLKEVGIEIGEVYLLVFYENPGVKFNRIISTFVHNPDTSKENIEYAINLWKDEKIWQKEFIKKCLNYSGKVITPLRHESHAASAFSPSPFEEAAILTLDGVGEWMTTTIVVGKEYQIKLLKELSFPHSLGMLYSAFT